MILVTKALFSLNYALVYNKYIPIILHKRSEKIWNSKRKKQLRQTDFR